jgi:phospholipid/cholesterol/gamma-HCH transport system substrate-binding protein
MAQRKELTWSELRVGVFVLLGIVVVMLGIFYVTGASFLGPKYRLVTYLPQVDGLTTGARVTLDGVEVGNVDSIEVNRPKTGGNPDPKRSVVVVMRISRDFQNDIRGDSTATLYTEGFIGDRTVSVQRGYTGMILQDGQEIPGLPEKSVSQIMANADDLVTSVNHVALKADAILGDVQNGRGTLGALLTDRTIYNNANQAIENVKQVTDGIQQGQGTVGKLLKDDALYAKANSVTGRLDDVMAAVQDQKGTLGKLIYDPGIHDEAKQFIDNTNGFVTDVRAGRGTLGKLATDDTLFASYKQIGENLSQATAQMDKNESTVGKIFNDPTFYDNLTGLTGDLRKLVGDFRSNPKKFLHVKFSIF